MDELIGRKKVKTTKAKHKSDAFKFLTEFKEKLKPKPRVIAISDLKMAVMNHIKYHLRESTIKMFESAFKHMDIFFGNILIKFITPEQIEKFKEYRLVSGITKSTVNIQFRTIKSIFSLAVRWGFIEKNPCVGVKQYIIEEKERFAFNEIEIQRIIENLPEGVLKSIVIFALNTGCRLDEIINLQWGDINLTEKIIVIRNKENFKTKVGKIRYIPISETLYNLLERNKPLNLKEILDDYTFSKSRNYKYDRSYISKKFKDHLRKLNFPERYHFHCLRHTFITQLARKGVNIYDIKELAGHSDIKTTEGYMHIMKDDLRRAVNLIEI